MSLGGGSAIPEAPATAEPVLQLGAPDANALWLHWSVDPLVWLGVALFVWLFLRGASRRHVRLASLPGVSFLGTLGLIWLFLATPLSYIAGHLFAMQQVQNLILHIVAPLAIFFAAPQAMLFAGLPARVRLNLVMRPRRHPVLRLIGRGLSHPIIAVALFVLALTLWQVPVLHNAAVLHWGMRDLMQVSMIASGAILFRLILDPRDEPQGVSYGYRQMMIAGIIIAQIGTGAVISLSSDVLYPAYDQVGRLFGAPALVDETNGGFILWVASALVLVLVVLLVMSRWNGAEQKRFEKTGHIWATTSMGNLMSPQTAEELWMLVTPRNRKVAIGLGLVALMMFVMIMGVVQVVHMAAQTGV